MKQGLHLLLPEKKSVVTLQWHSYGLENALPVPQSAQFIENNDHPPLKTLSIITQKVRQKAYKNLLPHFFYQIILLLNLMLNQIQFVSGTLILR